MQRKEPISIGDVLRLTLQEGDMQSRLDERRAIEAWPKIVGPEMATLCSRPEVENGIMKVSSNNASLRHELSMSRSILCNSINRYLGKNVISDIQFTSI